MRRLCVLLLAGCAVAPEPTGSPAYCTSPPSPVDDSHPLASPLQAELDAAVRDGLPGVVLAIRDAHGLWEGSAGLVDLARETPAETCHRTRVASVTKTFVAVTVLQLVEEGLIDLDASILAYLPERASGIPNAAQITVRQLLNHTSGIYNFLDVSIVLALFNTPDRTWTMEACYDNALGQDAAFPPGTGWGYSNTNYLLLGWIIEAVTGAPHEDALDSRIFAPLQMTDTTYSPDDFENAGVVHGYFDLMGDRVLVDSTEDYANLCIGPDGGMLSSARDLRTFYERLFGAGDLLSADSLAEMAPSVPTGEDDFPLYGLGVEAWGSSGPRGIGHGGHEFGYRTFAYHFPDEDVTFVFWVNASSLQPTPDNISAVINTHRDRLRDIVLGGP